MAIELLTTNFLGCRKHLIMTFIIVISVIFGCNAFADDNIGILPTVETRGQPWPMPSMYEPTDKVIAVDDKVFRLVGCKPDIMVQTYYGTDLL